MPCIDAFEINVLDMRVLIELEVLFGICASVCPLPGFAARAVDPEKPFISETGYQRFLGLSGDLQPNLTPYQFVRNVLTAHVTRDLKGKLLPIKPEYRDGCMRIGQRSIRHPNVMMSTAIYSAVDAT